MDINRITVIQIKAKGDSCPTATKDVAVNLKNRGNAIKSAMYGPLNPAEPNSDYWKDIAEEWDVDIASAKKQRCGNCVMFIVTPEIKDCINSGVTGGERQDEWAAIDAAGELGYCEAFDFKCAAKRTCRAWVTGGPITSTEKNKKDDSVEYNEKSLKEWFKEKWVDISRPKKGGGFEPCGRDDANQGKYPKCVPASKASKMSAEDISSAISRKRRAESTQVRDGNKPINVPTYKKDAFDSEEKSAIPTDAALYARVKAEAKAKFDVYPSAYANAWLVREYKKRGGGYRSEKSDDGDYEESIEHLTEMQLSDYYDWLDEKSDKPLKDPKGGLTAAGRAHFNRTEGSNLKPGVDGPADTPDKMRRKGSFLTRFFTTLSGPLKDENGKPTRLALSAAAWGEPIPETAEDAKNLAEKGRSLLEKYKKQTGLKTMNDSIIPKQVEFIADEKALGPTIGGASQADKQRDGIDRDGDGVINDGTEDERATPKKKRNERRDSAPRTNQPPRPERWTGDGPWMNEPPKPKKRREPRQNTPPIRPIPNNPKGRDTPARPIPNNPKGRDMPIRPIPNNPLPKKKKQTIYEGGRRYSRELMPNGSDPKNYPADEYDLVNPDGTPYQREKSLESDIALIIDVKALGGSIGRKIPNKPNVGKNPKDGDGDGFVVDLTSGLDNVPFKPLKPIDGSGRDRNTAPISIDLSQFDLATGKRKPTPKKPDAEEKPKPTLLPKPAKKDPDNRFDDAETEDIFKQMDRETPLLNKLRAFVMGDKPESTLPSAYQRPRGQTAESYRAMIRNQYQTLLANQKAMRESLKKRGYEDAEKARIEYNRSKRGAKSFNLSGTLLSDDSSEIFFPDQDELGED
jgi:hypothetical protein